jgi:hypothetical protein
VKGLLGTAALLAAGLSFEIADRVLTIDNCAFLTRRQENSSLTAHEFEDAGVSYNFALLPREEI